MHNSVGKDLVFLPHVGQGEWPQIFAAMEVIDLTETPPRDGEHHGNYTIDLTTNETVYITIQGPPKALPRSRHFRNGFFNPARRQISLFKEMVRQQVPSTRTGVVFSFATPVQVTSNSSWKGRTQILKGEKESLACWEAWFPQWGPYDQILITSASLYLMASMEWCTMMIGRLWILLHTNCLTRKVCAEVEQSWRYQSTIKSTETPNLNWHFQGSTDKHWNASSSMENHRKHLRHHQKPLLRR